jgi:hypothetical protein
VGRPVGLPPPLAAVLAEVVRALDGEPFDERRLRPVVVEALRSAGFDAPDAERGADVVRGLVIADPSRRALDDATAAGWFDDPALGTTIRVHETGGVRWFDRDAFETLAATISGLAGEPDPDRVAVLAALAEGAGYRVDELLASLAQPASTTSRRSKGVGSAP